MKKKQPQKTELERRLEEEIEKEAQAQAAADSEEAPPEEEAPAEAQQQSAALEEEIDALNDTLLRAHAEFDNYRKRMARDQEKLRKTAAENLLRGLLPVLDNLDRALQHRDDTTGAFTEGVEMVLNQLNDLLAQHGVEPIPAVGEAFDPNIHEAVAHVESEDMAENSITEEFLRGYILSDLVLRPSKVAVSKGPSEHMAKSE